MKIRIGILSDKTINYKLVGHYIERKLPDGILFEPQSPADFFELENVTIGIGFHWQRQETQTFRGALEIIQLHNSQYAINIIDIEDYLQSVISSEMSATSSIELLKTHAVISRSWAANAVINKTTNCACDTSTRFRISRFYERDAHTDFDVCADDHCQRYQGISRICSDNVKKAIEATRGLVLKYKGKIADARFYKCCGGMTEQFENVWAEIPHPYLIAKRDIISEEASMPDLTNENNARQWIMSEPQAFCNTNDNAVLSQVLNNYDRETPDFYRWTVRYTQQELTDIINAKSGMDFGLITDIQPIRRGPSGRLIEIKIKGTKCEIIVGKELEIRKWLSLSHLYSSAFVINRDSDNGFILHGAGWGHGVGLCQIGAAMIAHNGYSYQQILQHYFPHTEIEQL